LAASSENSRLRLFAWLGVVTLFIPALLFVTPAPEFEPVGTGYQVVAVWTLVLYVRYPGPSTAQLRFTPTAFYSPSWFTNVGLLFLAEFLLLALGCALLFKNRKSGAVPFILAATAESALYAYVVWASFVCCQPLPPPTVYFLPVGTVFAGVTGVGALVFAGKTAAGKSYLSSG